MTYPSLLDSVCGSFHVGTLRVLDILLAPVAIKRFLEVSEQSEVQVLGNHDHLTSDRFPSGRAQVLLRSVQKSCQLRIWGVLFCYTVPMYTAGEQELYQIRYGNETNKCA